MRLSLQKTQTTIVPTMTGADKEETKTMLKKEDNQTKSIAVEGGKQSELKLATGNAMRDGIRKKLADLMIQEESDENQIYLGTKVAYEIEN